MPKDGDVICLIPEVNEVGPGAVVALYPEGTEPFGLDFRSKISPATAATTTTKTVSVTWGPDADTDPEDSDA